MIPSRWTGWSCTARPLFAIGRPQHATTLNPNFCPPVPGRKPLFPGCGARPRPQGSDWSYGCQPACVALRRKSKWPCRAPRHAVAPTCTASPWAIQMASWLRIALRMPLQLHALSSAADALTRWDLRREARERLLAELCDQYPEGPARVARCRCPRTAKTYPGPQGEWCGGGRAVPVARLIDRPVRDSWLTFDPRRLRRRSCAATSPVNALRPVRRLKRILAMSAQPGPVPSSLLVRTARPRTR
jgi:hypothetical protein